jgi:hypothetical protein
MSALKLHTLKQKLWAIVAASFIARVVAFFALPNTPSSLAPDEGTYAPLAEWVARGVLDEQHPYYTALFNVSKSLIFPSSLFIDLGMDGLSAIRLTSSIYGFFSLCAVVYFSSKLLQSSLPRLVGNKKIERLTIFLVGVYASMPSHFFWSSLGLRESPNEFWLILTFVGVFLMYREEQSKKILLLGLIFISIVCTFNSRPQVGWVLVTTLLIYSLFRLKNKLTYLLISSVFTGLFVGYLTTTSFVYVTSDVYVAKDASPTPTNDASPTPTNDASPTPTNDASPTPTNDASPTPTNRGEFDASKLCDGTKTRVEYEGKKYDCVKSGTITKRERPSNLAELAIDQVEVLPGKQIVNQIGAASMIERLTCPWDESSEIGKYGCLAFRAPYMTLTFLFRPLPLIDTTSLPSVFAAVENALWIAMFTLVLYRIFKVKKIAFPAEIAPAMIFFSLYVVGAGSYEGNMGTAFRHKSLILWIVLLLIFALFWHSEDKAREPRGNNSQESAV